MDKKLSPLTIAIMAKGKGPKGKEEDSGDEGSEKLSDVAGEIREAISSSDDKELARVLKSFIRICES